MPLNGITDLRCGLASPGEAGDRLGLQASHGRAEAPRREGRKLNVTTARLVFSVSGQKWHEDYSLFRKVSVYLLTGLELYQKNQ